MRGQRHVSAAFYPRERPDIHCTGSWVGASAGLDIFCVGVERKSMPLLKVSPASPARPSFRSKGKVKRTHVQALTLCTGRTAHRGSRGIALPFHDHGTRRGRGVSVTPRMFFTPGKTGYPFYWRLGGPQGRSGHFLCGNREKKHAFVKSFSCFARSSFF